jgi:hypothetical protein
LKFIQRVDKNNAEKALTTSWSFSLSQMVGPGMGLVTDLHNVERAKIEKQVFLEISGAAKESKTKVRLPDAARRHVEMLTQNGPVETTYIDAEHFFQYFQEAGVDPMEVAKELGVEESDVTMALATEGRLAVPTSEYAVKIAGTAAGDALLDDVTFTPEGLTMREASTFMTEQKEIERRALEKAEQLIAEDEALEADLEYVKSSFMTQALSAGVAADVAEGNASLFKARAKAILGRYGINPREWYDRIGLQISQTEEAGRVEYHQPLNPDVDLDMEVPVVDLTDVAPVRISGSGSKAFVEQWKGAPLKISTGKDGKVLDAHLYRKDPRHVFWSSDKRSRRNAKRNKALAALERVLANTVLIESFPNQKKQQKPKVKNVHRFYVPVKDNTGVATLRLVAFEMGNGDITVDGVELYDIIGEKQELPPSREGSPLWDNSLPEEASNPVEGRAFSGKRDASPGKYLTIRQMLAGVKDSGGQPYYQSAFHGSPHRFDRFTLEHIGTGEGMQAYGWGLYFAGDKGIAEWYRHNLVSKQVSDKYLSWAMSNEGLANLFEDELYVYADRNLDLADISAEFSNVFYRDAHNMPQVISDKLVKEILKYKDKTPTQGQLYEVDIPSDNVLLDWDKPLSEQSEHVKSALKDYINQGASEASTGSWIYKELQAPFVAEGLGYKIKDDDSSDARKEAASKYLNSIGIKGIKYLDSTSRAKGEGAYNYVIFDDEAIEVLNTFYQGKARNSMAALDADYLSAVEAGDMESAQRMVDEAARKAGYIVEGWHGSRTGKVFNVFDNGMSFFSSDPEVAHRFAEEGMYVISINGDKQVISKNTFESILIEPFETEDWHLGWNWLQEEDEYSDRTRQNLADWFPEVATAESVIIERSEAGDEYRRFYLKIGTPIYHDYGGALWRPGNESPERKIGNAEVLVAKNIREGGATAEKDLPIADTIVIKDRTAIKSADAVTYDDSGNPIPLSERFNLETADIRYQRDDRFSPRGSTSFSSRETVIRLFETSDRSTLLHETGHVFLEDLRSLALENEKAAEDLKAVQDWLGVEDWVTLTREQRVAAHEKFARTFEAYLMNGEAPSEGLRRVFRNFRSWLVSIYKDIVGLSQEAGEDIALSDEAKDIFNRLLATDEDIEIARNMAGYETATETTLESLARHAMANGKAVEDVGKVPSAKDLKKRRLELTEQIKTELEESRGYSTLNSMKRAANKGGIKINEAEAIEVYGKEFVDQNLKPLGVLSKQSTWQMDDLAVRFGYGSGDEMVRDLSTLPPINEVVKQQVDIMMEREAALSEGEAAGALRNDDRLEALAIEREDIAQKLKGEVKESEMPDWAKDMGEDTSAKDVDVAVNDESLPWLVWILGNDESLKYLRKRKRSLNKALKEAMAAFETDRSDDIRAQMVDLQNEIDYIAEADSILKETIKAAKEMSGETTNKPKRQEKVESSLRWEHVSVEEAINAAVTSPTAMASMKEAWGLAQRVSRLAFKEGSEEAKSRARDIKRQMREAVKQVTEARERWRKDARAIAKSRAQAAKEINADDEVSSHILKGCYGDIFHKFAVDEESIVYLHRNKNTWDARACHYGSRHISTFKHHFFTACNIRCYHCEGNTGFVKGNISEIVYYEQRLPQGLVLFFLSL